MCYTVLTRYPRCGHNTRRVFLCEKCPNAYNILECEMGAKDLRHIINKRDCGCKQPLVCAVEKEAEAALKGEKTSEYSYSESTTEVATDIEDEDECDISASVSFLERFQQLALEQADEDIAEEVVRGIIEKVIGDVGGEGESTVSEQQKEDDNKEANEDDASLDICKWVCAGETEATTQLIDEVIRLSRQNGESTDLIINEVVQEVVKKLIKEVIKQADRDIGGEVINIGEKAEEGNEDVSDDILAFLGGEHGE